MEGKSPRERRLISDLRSLEKLQRESCYFQFAVCHRGVGEIPDNYHLCFHGPSLQRSDGSFTAQVSISTEHRVQVTLGPQYPRLGPQLRWLTPIFHPNIANGGSVCLGGYSTHWVPSLMLDQLCEMLWDMLCFRNFNLASPYNREAASWMHQQKTFQFPLLSEPLRIRSRRTASVPDDLVFLDS